MERVAVEQQSAEEENPISERNAKNANKGSGEEFVTADGEEEQTRKSLIAKLLGKKIEFNVLKEKLHRLWSKSGEIVAIDMGNGFVRVEFRSEDDYDSVLARVPWLIFGHHYLAVRQWRPDFNPNSSSSIGKIVTWVRLPSLPIEYYDKRVLYAVGDVIGRTLKLDHYTANVLRAKYARLCVEVDLGKPLLTRFKIMGSVIRIEYERLQVICFGCGKYGHAKEKCPLGNSAQKLSQPAQRPMNKLNSGKVVGVGPGDRNRDGKHIPVSVKK